MPVFYTYLLMILDHVLGRPSVHFRKIQVLAVVSFWSFYLFRYAYLAADQNQLIFRRGHKHGPPTVRKLSRRLNTLLTPWQTLVITLLYLYIARNLGKLLGLECPEPLANLYTRSYFRATWVTTALDAGFWTAMKIRRKWVRDLASVIFTVYYLIAAEQADEKVRKVRGLMTVDHLRVSWNKGTTPYIGALTALMRPRFMKYPPRKIRIPRPHNSDYQEPVNGWLYFDGPLAELKNHHKIVVDIPGGGFVAMNPRSNDDKLFAWAGKTGLPILSLDYQKAPEFPYPYALNECFDVYSTITASRGRCLGLAGDVIPKIILTGDSAGGNLATSLTLMIIESRLSSRDEEPLPIPQGLVLIYPGLDMNIGNWMSDEQLSLVKDRRSRRTNKNILRSKTAQYNLAAGTPHHSDAEDEEMQPLKTISAQLVSTPGQIDKSSQKPASISLPSPQYSTAPPPLLSPPLTRTQAKSESLTKKTVPNQEQDHERSKSVSHRVEPLRTRLAMSSMISYFNDRILSPEMMRAMIILYIGPHNRPDFSSDYLLSPILAPDSLLQEFPKTYFLTGERDPLVDDTVIFAGRLRRAKAQKHEMKRGRKGGLGREFDDRDVVEVVLIPGISHGFLQFVGCFPEGWKYIHRCGRWMSEIFQEASEREGATAGGGERRKSLVSSGDEDMGLEMSSIRKEKGKGMEVGKEEKERLLREQLKERGESRGRGRGRTGAGNGKDERGLEGKRTKNKSMVSLASEEDLLGRRMNGLVGPLSGLQEDD